MRPERLTVQAFGPFTGRESIDFSQFGEQPMILINGPTGAGKSTILDAICFALYGHTSGGDRDASHMRSQQADAKLLSEVDFTFSLGADRWRVNRVPRQRRPKLKGDGETEQNPKAALWRIDGGVETVEIPRGVEEVTKFIEGLTGLNADQFRQVMVLPQGRFRELLVAPSARREEIFSTLFDSGIYKRIEDTLKEKAKQLRDQVSALSSETDGVLKAAGMESRDALDQALEHLSPVVTLASDKRLAARKARDQAREAANSGTQLAKDFLRLQDARNEVDRLEQLSDSLAEDRTRLARSQSALQLEQDYTLLKNAIEQRDSSRKNVEVHSQVTVSTVKVLEQSKHQYQTAEIEKSKTTGLQRELQQLQKVQESQAEVDLRRQKLNEIQVQVEKTTAELKIATAALETSKKQVSELDIKVERDRSRLLEHSGVEATLAILGESIKKHTDLIDVKTRLATLDKQLERETTRRVTAAEQVKSAVQAVTELEYQWHAGQAMLLARTLGEGTPCPVCGSVDHPSPCNVLPAAGLVDQDQVEKARKHLESQRAELQKRETVCQKLSDDKTRLVSDVSRLESELAASGNEPLNQLEKIHADQLKLKHELESIRVAFPATEQALKKALDQADQADITLGEKKVAASGAQVSAKQADDEWQRVLQQVPEEYRDGTKLQNTITALIGQLSQIEETFSAADKTLQAAQMQHAEATSKAATLVESEKSANDHLSGIRVQWERTLALSDFTDEADFKRARLTTDALSLLSGQLQAHDQALATARGALSEVSVMVKGKAHPDVPALQALVEKAEHELTQADNIFQAEQDQLNGLLSAQKALAGNETAEQQLHAQYSVVGRLSDTASGQSSSRISLQRFVLSVLLDDVLLDASRRLREMSRQRYKLVRRQDAAGGRRASGLDLDVLDAWSGRSRPVSTLSGGESFQAALALALGLSDVVQAYAGGIRLDTLFIDEGFGSLDADSLERAIEMLVDLQATGRMIGVISHVTEMKEQIAQRLDVVPSPVGSRIQMQV